MSWTGQLTDINMTSEFRDLDELNWSVKRCQYDARI